MPISKVFLYTLCVSLGGFIFGFDASVISGAVNFIVEEFALTPIQLGFVVSAPTLGATIAILFAGLLADKLGRRKLLRLIAILYLASAVASALATDYWVLVIARFLGGLAFCSLMVAPMYIAEIATAKSRGKMVSVNQLNIVLGFSAAYFANYFILQAANADGAFAQSLALSDNIWRYMLGLEIIPAIIWFVLLLVIPKSPRWLVMQGQFSEAKKVLVTLRGGDEQKAEHELASVTVERQGEIGSFSASIKALFGKKLRLALTIGIVVGIAQQLSGINAIFFYAPNIFEQSGVGTNAAFSQAVYVGLINVLFTVLAMAVIDRFGRRPLLLLGLGGVFISMMICSYGFSQATYQLTEKGYVELSKKQTNEASTGIAELTVIVGLEFESDVAFKKQVRSIVGSVKYQQIESDLLRLSTNINAPLILFGILAFVASFAFSLGPVMWVLFSEIFPNHLRGVAVSLVSVINSLVSFLVTFLFPIQLETFGAAITMFIYGLSALVTLGFIYWVLPETKGKSLEQITEQMARAHSKPSETA